MDTEHTLPQWDGRFAYDEAWYERFRSAGSFEDYAYFGDTREARTRERERFFAGEVRNPTLRYPKLADFDFEGRERALHTLQADITLFEENPTVRRAYEERIAAKKIELSMMYAALHGQDDAFCKVSSFLYGSPDPNVHSYNLAQLLVQIGERRESPDHQCASPSQNSTDKFYRAHGA